MTSLTTRAEAAEEKLSVAELILSGLLRSIDEGEKDAEILRHQIAEALEVVKRPQT